MTTWQSNDDNRRDGGAEVAEFIDAPVLPETDERTRDDDGDDADDRRDGEEPRPPG